MEVAVPVDGEPQQNEGNSNAYLQIAHDRAGQAGAERRRSLLSLSSGGVAAFFLALTGNAKDALTIVEKLALSAGAVFFGLAVLSGIWLWQVEAKRWYARARCEEAKTKTAKTRFYKASRRWGTIRTFLSITQQTVFLLGVAAAIVFTISKAWRL
jgi:hypothetical protein